MGPLAAWMRSGAWPDDLTNACAGGRRGDALSLQGAAGGGAGRAPGHAAGGSGNAAQLPGGADSSSAPVHQSLQCFRILFTCSSAGRIVENEILIPAAHVYQNTYIHTHTTYISYTHTSWQTQRGPMGKLQHAGLHAVDIVGCSLQAKEQPYLHVLSSTGTSVQAAFYSTDAAELAERHPGVAALLAAAGKPRNGCYKAATADLVAAADAPPHQARAVASGACDALQHISVSCIAHLVCTCAGDSSSPSGDVLSIRRATVDRRCIQM